MSTWNHPVTDSDDLSVELFWRTLVQDWNKVNLILITQIEELPRKIEVWREN